MAKESTNKEIRDAAVKDVMCKVGLTCNPVTQYIAEAVIEKNLKEDGVESMKELIEHVRSVAEPADEPNFENDGGHGDIDHNEIYTIGNREFNPDDFSLETGDDKDYFKIRFNKSFEEIYDISRFGLTVEKLSASFWTDGEEMNDELIVSNYGDAPDIFIGLSKREQKVFLLAAAECKITQLQNLCDELKAEIEEIENEIN